MLIIVIAACSKQDGSEITRNAIDQDYLNSKSYQSFVEQARQEQAQSTLQRKNFVRFARKQLAENGGKTVELPLVINEELIKASYTNKVIESSSLTTILGLKQIFHPLVNVGVNGKNYYLFLTCKVASYKECLVWFASMQAGELIHLKMLTNYLQSLSYGEIPLIKMTSSAIMIHVKQRVEYPFSTFNSYQLQYQLTSDGQIFRSHNN